MQDLMVVVSNANINNNPLETIAAIKEAGFKNVFIQWYNRDFIVSQEKQLEYIKSLGLNVPYAHLTYDGIPDLWNDSGDYLIDKYKKDLDVCHQNGITLVMMHVTSRKTQPLEYNEKGIKRLQAIADYAEKLNIKIAFENVHYPGFLEYVLSNIKNKNVGICFDAGHYHYYFKDEFNFDFFKDRILAVHLHDNHGSSDEHLLPFDGTNNWEEIISKLKENNYNGYIILEIVYSKHYPNMNIKDFYKEGLIRGQKLQKMFKER